MFARIPFFPSRQLDGEIANRSPLDVATMDFEPRGLPGETVEQHIAAATTHNVEPASPTPSQIAKCLRANHERFSPSFQTRSGRF